MTTKRVLLHEYWGKPTNERSAEVYLVNEYYEVDFKDKDKLIESRKMISFPGGIIHSEQYAEDAAENWCLEVIK